MFPSKLIQSAEGHLDWLGNYSLGPGSMMQNVNLYTFCVLKSTWFLSREKLKASTSQFSRIQVNMPLTQQVSNAFAVRPGKLLFWFS